ncbi:MAG: Ribonuclease [Planctomycetota bacterium]
MSPVASRPLMADATPVSLFTDGACTGNPGPGGWAFLARAEDGSAESWAVEGSGGERSTTNNRMELLAAIRGFEAISEALGDGCEVALHSDSQYVTKGLGEWLDGWKRKGWRTTSGPVKNTDLWKQLDEFRRRHRIRTIWVRGHNGHPENEWCDRAAVAAIPRS